MATWTSEQTLLLIELYKQLNCGSLTSREENQKKLLLVAEKLRKVRPGTTLSDVKLKIKTVRSQYAKEKLKAKAYRAQNKAYKPKLWCYNLITFFDDIDKKRFHRNNITSEPELPLKEEHDYCGNVSDEHSNYDSMENMQQETSYLHDSIDSQTSESQSEPVRIMVNNAVNSATNYLREMENYEESTNDILETKITNPLEETQTLQININSHARNYTFATFICEELSNIEDDEILENVKWAIQTILHNASTKTLERK